MKSKLFSIALIGFIAFALSSWTTINMGGATHTSYSYDEPYTASFPHPCTGELVNYSGTLHISGAVTITPNGKVHMTHHEHLKDVFGIGVNTGNVYHYIGGINMSTNMNVGQTYQGNMNTVLTGNGDNATMHLRIHLTVNANGDVTVDRTVLSSNCSN